MDKQPSSGYAKVDTLHKPACPRYRTELRHLGPIRRNKPASYKRYYEVSKHNRNSALVENSTSNEEFASGTKTFKERLSQNPKDITIWLEYVNYQNSFPMSSSKAQLCERKLDVLRQGMLANPSNNQLYREYVRIVEDTYPSYEVSKLLEALIANGMCVLVQCYVAFVSIMFYILFVSSF